VKMRSFVSWIGAGRKLTQTGRIMLGILVLNRPEDGDHADDNAELSDLGQYAIRFLLDLA
jgi:hypothetical protein